MTQASTQKSKQKPHVTIHRKDYTAPAYWVDTVEMGFDLDPAATRVATRITLRRNSASPNRDVELLGDGAKLVALRMNGKALRKGGKGGYTIADGKLRIANAPDAVTLEIQNYWGQHRNSFRLIGDDRERMNVTIGVSIAIVFRSIGDDHERMKIDGFSLD